MSDKAPIPHIPIIRGVSTLIIVASVLIGCCDGSPRNQQRVTAQGNEIVASYPAATQILTPLTMTAAATITQPPTLREMEVPATPTTAPTATSDQAVTSTNLAQDTATVTTTLETSKSEVPLQNRENPLLGETLYVPEVDAPLQQEIENLKESDPQMSAALEDFANQPHGIWLVGGSEDDSQIVEEVLLDAVAKDQVPTFVLYNIPNRDVGGASKGGANSIDRYRIWIDGISNAMAKVKAKTGKDPKVVFVTEPDSTGQLNQLSGPERIERIEALKYAINAVQQNPNAIVYAGVSTWLLPEKNVEILKQLGIARGAIAVSGYLTPAKIQEYVNQMVRYMPGFQAIGDVSRGGNPNIPAGWENVQDAKIGPRPYILDKPSGNGVIAFFWFKKADEADGSKYGAPGAGQFWLEGLKRMLQGTDYGKRDPEVTPSESPTIATTTDTPTPVEQVTQTTQAEVDVNNRDPHKGIISAGQVNKVIGGKKIENGVVMNNGSQAIFLKLDFGGGRVSSIAIEGTSNAPIVSGTAQIIIDRWDNNGQDMPTEPEGSVKFTSRGGYISINVKDLKFKNGQPLENIGVRDMTVRLFLTKGSMLVLKNVKVLYE